MPTSAEKSDPLELPDIMSSLDNLALQLLRKKFSGVDVEAYYRAAEAFVQENLRYDKNYRRDVTEEKPLKTLFRLSLDKIGSAYALISGKVDEKEVNELLIDYETLVEAYLENKGFLI